MANPQVEDGHTRIANELMEQLMKLYLAPNQWQVLVCIMRKTYGFHKKVDYITNTQICEGTGLLKSNVSRAVTILAQRKIISRNGKHIGLQKDWEQWEQLSVQATNVIGPDNLFEGEKLSIPQPKLSNLQPELSEQITKVISPLDTQKIKDTIQKKLYKRKFGEFQNVLLTDEEYQKLKGSWGAQAEAMIERLSAYKESKGKKYKSDYATILNWQRRDSGKTRNPRELPTSYTPSPDYGDSD